MQNLYFITDVNYSCSILPKRKKKVEMITRPKNMVSFPRSARYGFLLENVLDAKLYTIQAEILHEITTGNML